MNYRLVVLTHQGGDTLADTLAAFANRVTPRPSSVLLRADRPTFDIDVAMRIISADIGAPVYADWFDAPGFCASTARAWALAATGGGIPERETLARDYEHVLWWEHDFLVTRPVDLRELAAVLDANPQLAQMALMRGAVNATERAAGGLFESRPGQYEPRRTMFGTARGDTETGAHVLRAGDQKIIADAGGTEPDWGPYSWLEHRAYLTTNPSLMRRDFMAANPWPEYESECEGRFGIDLLARGYTFGVWGTGEPWTKHIGVRDGFGY